MLDKTTNSGLHLSRYDALYNCRVKIYPGEAFPDEIIITSEPIFNPDKVEIETRDAYDLTINGTEENTVDEETESRQAWNRARRRAYDLIRSNSDLNAFVTLTFDQNEVDRTSWDEIVNKLNPWLSNRVQRNALKYVLVPEYHRDGESYHFHGLCNLESLKLEFSGHYGKNHKKVFNIVDFPFGFTTVIEVSGAERTKACAGYIFKYMSKQGNGAHKIGHRYTLCGGKLQKPTFLYRKIDYDTIKKQGKQTQGFFAIKVFSGEECADFVYE